MVGDIDSDKKKPMRRKLPDVHCEGYSTFYDGLKLFHRNNGTPFQHIPLINGQEINLFTFYNLVTALGGFQSVNLEQKWNIITELLKLPKACVNLSSALRQIYLRYLWNYEKIHFKTEEPDSDKSQSARSHCKKQTSLHSVPMFYNHMQHDIPDEVRAASGLSISFLTPTDYDKLCMSLISGLPNEQELAISICTLLANEGNDMLLLDQCPKVVDFLIAQAGVLPLEDNSLEEILFKGWDDVKGHNMRRFWRSALNNDSKVIKLYNWAFPKQDPSDDLFNLELDLGSLNNEGQQVLRIALILHNLSFEKDNEVVLASNSNVLRFFILCMHTKWSDLMQIAYDAFTNLSSSIRLTLENDLSHEVFFQTVKDGIQSSDRFLVIKSLDIFSKLCVCETNKNVIPLKILDVCPKMISFLTVHDIVLLFFALEAIYALSDLGKYACEKISEVYQSINILFNILTLEPINYGPLTHYQMKITETVPTESEPEIEENEISPLPNIPNNEDTITAPVDINTESLKIVTDWLKSTYKYKFGSSVFQNEIYDDYIKFCDKIVEQNVMNYNSFSMFVKNMFSKCILRKVVSENGLLSFYEGLQKRKKKMPVSQKNAVSPKSSNKCAILGKKLPLSLNDKKMFFNCKFLKTASHTAKSHLSSRHVNSNLLNTKKSSPASVTSPNEDLTLSISSTSHISQNTPSAIQVQKPSSNSNMQKNNILNNTVQQQNLQKSNAKVKICCTREKISNTFQNTFTQANTTSIRPNSNQHYLTPKLAHSLIEQKIHTRSRMNAPSKFNILKEDSKSDKFPLNKAFIAMCQEGTFPNISSKTDKQTEYKTPLKSVTTQAFQIKSVHNHVISEKNITDSSDSGFSDNESMKDSNFSNDSEKMCFISSNNGYALTSGQLVTSVNCIPNLSNTDFSLCTKSINEKECSISEVLSANDTFPSAISQNVQPNKSSKFPAKDLLNPNQISTSDSKCNFKKKSSIINTSSLNLLSAADSSSANENNSKEMHCHTSNIQSSNDTSSCTSKNSNEDSFFTSISDAVPTLEYTSKIILNAKNNLQIPITKACDATVSTSVCETNTHASIKSEMKHSNPITSVLIQSNSDMPNLNSKCNEKSKKFDNLCVVSKLTHLDQVKEPIIKNSISSDTCNKRTFPDNQKLTFPDNKKSRIEAKTSLLEAALTTSSYNMVCDMNLKLYDNHHHLPLKLAIASDTENLAQLFDLKAVGAITVSEKDVDFLLEKDKTFFGLSSINKNFVETKEDLSSTCSSSSNQEYICEWENCGKKFFSSESIFGHVNKTHILHCSDNMNCLWKGCNLMKRRYFSLLTHLQDVHCNKIPCNEPLEPNNEPKQKNSLIDSSKISSSSIDYASSTALQTIKKHALEYVNLTEISEEEESVLAKSIRLTSALILRNLVTHSSVARTNLRCYESELVYLAMSPIEASQIIAQCLVKLSCA